MNAVDELIAKYRVEQSKYAYYLIALCVAAVGFSVSQTMGRALNLSLWPLGVAITCFGFSILSGLKFIKLVIGGIGTDIDIKQIEMGNSESLIKAAMSLHVNPHLLEVKKLAVGAVHEGAKKKSFWSRFWYSCQSLMFYLGMIFFIAWRVYEMQLLSLTA